ncbi:MAG: hypothetical protein ACFE91_06010 [Promethearchaeota archaeon]
MGIYVLNREIEIINSKPDASEKILDISNLIIPFSVLFMKESPPDIYCGEEEIPFEEKDSKFKQILISEFLFE